MFMYELTPNPLERPARFDPWQSIAATLKRHPGVWHEITGDSTTATTNVADGVLVAFRPASHYQARRLGRERVLEVRFVGDFPEVVGK
jgi:hypothetical protein